MDGENNGSKTLWTNGWFGGTIIFGNIHIILNNLHFGVTMLVFLGGVVVLSFCGVFYLFFVQMWVYVWVLVGILAI